MLQNGALLLLSGLVSCFILFIVSTRFKYYFKFIVYLFGLMVIGFMLLPVVVIRKNTTKNAKLAGTWEVRLASLIGVKYEVRGAKLFENFGPGIAVFNHQSTLDNCAASAAMLAIGSENCFGIAKRSVLFAPGFGLMMHLCKAQIYVDRANPVESRKALLEGAYRAKRDNGRLVIFPEGSRNSGPKFLPFKKGAFYSAIQCQLPIIPIVVSPYTFIQHDSKVFGSGRVVIQVLPPILPQDFGTSSPQELADRTSALMQAEYDRLSSNCRQNGGVN